LGVALRSVDRHDNRLGSRHCNRRAIKGEGAGARNTLIGQTRYRGTYQNEGEGEDEADGPHVTVSGFGARRPRRFVGKVITNGCFRLSAPKAENGFIPARIVSSTRSDETLAGKKQ
jgi:hypothetical protein